MQIKINDNTQTYPKDTLIKLPYFEGILNGHYIESEKNMVDLSWSVPNFDVFNTALEINETGVLTCNMLTAMALNTLHYFGARIDCDEVYQCFVGNDMYNVEMYEYLYHYLDVSTLPNGHIPWYTVKGCRDKVGQFLVDNIVNNKCGYFHYRYYAHYFLVDCGIDILDRVIRTDVIDCMMNDIGVELHQKAKNWLLFYLLNRNYYLEAMECICIGADVNFVYGNMDVMSMVMFKKKYFRARNLNPRRLILEELVYNTILEHGYNPTLDIHRDTIKKMIGYMPLSKMQLLFVKDLATTWRFPLDAIDLKNLLFYVSDIDFSLIDVTGINLEQKVQDNRTILDLAIRSDNTYLINIYIENRVKPSYKTTLQFALDKNNMKVINYCKNFYKQ